MREVDGWAYCMLVSNADETPDLNVHNQRLSARGNNHLPMSGESNVSSQDRAGLQERVLPSLPLMRGGVGRFDRGT